MKSKQRNEQPTGRLKSLQEIQITAPTSHYDVLKNSGRDRILMTSFVHSGLRNKPLLEKTIAHRPRYTLSWINGFLIIRDNHAHGILEIIPGNGVNLNTILDTLNQLRGLTLHGENQLFIDNPDFTVHKQTTLCLNNAIVKGYSSKPLYLEGCLDLNNISIRTESLVNFCNMLNKK